MALTSNLEVDHYIDQELRSFQTATSSHIFKGALVGLTGGGYAAPLTAGDPFVGVAYEEIDNSTGADGDESVRVYTLGDFGLTLAGSTVADIGRPVFASADDSLTFSAIGNSFVGFVEDFIGAGEIIVRIDPGGHPLKTAIHAVEDLAAGFDIAARALHAFDQSGWIVAARVVNQASTPAGIDDANPCVVTLATGVGTVAAKTFNSTAPFPGANAMADLGGIANAHAGAGAVLTLAVTNGATANPGPFLVEVDYV
ncbi:MAG: hypothetical protein ACE5E5_13305 [Phycisphaerae bacterium]